MNDELVNPKIVNSGSMNRAEREIARLVSPFEFHRTRFWETEGSKVVSRTLRWKTACTSSYSDVRGFVWKLSGFTTARTKPTKFYFLPRTTKLFATWWNTIEKEDYEYRFFVCLNSLTSRFAAIDVSSGWLQNIYRRWLFLLSRKANLIEKESLQTNGRTLA